MLKDMEKTNFPVFGNMADFRPFEFEAFQEPFCPGNQEAFTSLLPQPLPFNPEQGSSSFSFGVDQTAQFLNVEPDKGLDHFQGNGVTTLVTDENREFNWQRMRWTNDTVKVLINAVSYIVKALSDYEKGDLSVPVKGKWRAVSIAMCERGYSVSPQQCEDKFNDINRKYKRITDLLGRASCDVVQDPTLLGSVNISEEAKEEVRRLLCCRQLFYQEMCSFHNWNRLHLPHDPSLEKSVICALTGKPNNEARNYPELENHPAKRLKLGDDKNEEQVSQRALELKEMSLNLEKKMIDLEKERIDWLKFCQGEERKLQKLRIENEMMKLENKRLLMEIKRMEDRSN